SIHMIFDEFGKLSNKENLEDNDLKQPLHIQRDALENKATDDPIKLEDNEESAPE
ncbi:hypothetical protein HAX54_004615, partial [Datura stramonium]|nr:hypothetical protein [Datura stramonium]